VFEGVRAMVFNATFNNISVILGWTSLKLQISELILIMKMFLSI